MRVAALARGLKHSRLANPESGAQIIDITNDSRAVTTGSLYAALPGRRHDGHEFILGAIRAGATAILCTHLPHEVDPRVAWFLAEEPRLALSEMSDRFYRSPSRELRVIGVTGTDGKTSTVYFAHQLLQALGGASAFLSTAALQIGPQEQPNPLHQSTPEAPEVHRALRSMRRHGARYAVVESTSHGLSRKTCRLAHVHYAAAVFTNLSHEHLEFHGTFEQYRDDKANLFRALDAGCYADAPDSPDAPSPASRIGDARSASLPPAGRVQSESATPFGVVCADDEHADYFTAATSRPVVTYGFASGADYRAAELQCETAGSTFRLMTPTGSAACTLPVPGDFNVANALAAAAVAQQLLGVGAEELAGAIGRLRAVRGRMDVVLGTPFSVIVDFAHTPGSFRTVLPFFRERCGGRLIVVFGSAGERDVAKRPLQGQIADEYADLIVLADEDPRGEDRMEILRQIAAGCPDRVDGETILLIPDRREAIRRAFARAKAGDTVLLLGKGHETSIIGASGEQPWDERSVAREELQRLDVLERDG